MSIPFKKKKPPELGEIVLAKVTRIIDRGAYAELLEYDAKDAFIPWSEISSKSIKDVRDVLKEGQVVIGKVIRVEKKPSKIDIDISLKRVTEGEKRVLVLRWKRVQKAQKIVEIVSKKLNKTLDEAYKSVWMYLEKNVDPLSIIEECVVSDYTALSKLGISEEWARAICEEAKKHVHVKMIRLRAIARITTYKPDGVERIRKILSSIYTVAENERNVKLEIYTVGAPRYRIEIEAPDYRKAEELFSKISSTLNKMVREEGVEEFELIKEEVLKG